MSTSLSSQPLRPKTGLAEPGKSVQVAQDLCASGRFGLGLQHGEQCLEFHFQSDSTYYVSSNVTMGGTNTTFDGGTILKYASDAGLTVNSPITWQGTPYLPVIMTAKDDNSDGGLISGSTGNPGTTYYANPALYFNASVASNNLVLHDLRAS